ncbi:RNA-binding E3 ubiquitin-protein ligase MEX3C [Lagenorhynchus albirostris]|uniref:RNA-binding E3 ubiquitin-protein ligase MEX3C n=1 Tax=Sagmatias obliquidens TaxID=3371155 RepID=UPI000F43E692|nr:RNA-binding E3 ubiquitin-protein ligase MEX3C [Lagenorhynchus obliquidens]XP_030723812.1 RNA-binding E3 ubiquitin-protein ligase MEX3C [Globicephala melas]XP_059885062.1 RNA-binding E3 ubiquitin-protein ligase MEX3C [Delphinus delphis]XP_059977293.1 RNA-binding E3 ubiquitin-protein ligase MEX3C [Lagenorhynchus albirostris]
MPSGSSAALALAAAPAPLPQPPPPPPPPPLPPPAGGPELEGDGLLLRERLAALGLDDPSPAESGAPALRAAAAQGQARRAAGLSPEERTPSGRPGVSEAAELELEEDEEEGEEAELDGDLLEEEELEEAEEEDRPSLLLLSPPAAAASQTQPIPGGSLGSVLLPAAGFDAREAAAAAGVLYGGDDAQGMMAAMLSHAYGPGGCGAAAAALNGEQAALLRRKSVNTTECVPVPSSEHVAEIVGRQGCKIKALRAKTNTYIKTPVRGEEPIFVVTGRKEDVAMAKREILSAAEHFSMIRASRNKNGPALGGLSCSPNLPGQTTVQVRVPYRVVGLVVGPKGATIKRIQQQTHTYIVTPSRDKEPVFEVTGMPENVDRAREEIEMHIAMRTGNYIELNEENDFHYNGTDVSFEGGTLGSAWLSSNPVPPSRARMISNYRNDSSSSLGSGSTDSYFGSNRLADFSPTSPFSTGNFWFGDTLPSVGSEDLAVDSPAFDSLPTSAQTIWTPFEPVNPLSGFGSDPPANMKTQRRGSQPSTPRLSPTFPESIEHPLARRVRSDPPSTGSHVGLPIYIPAFSNGTNSYSSSNGGSTSSSPPESRRKHDCVICFENEVIAALVPCGHNLFCMECANKICEKRTPSCPVCQTAVTQAIQIHS